MFRREGITVAAIVAFVCGFTLLGWVQGYPRQAILFPIIVSVLIAVFGAFRYWEIGRTLAAAGPGPDEERKRELAKDAGDLQILSAVRPFLWIFAVLGFIWLLGFLAGLTLYVLVFLIAHRIPWRRAVLVAAGTFVFVLVIFQIVLGVLLPVGLIPELIGL